jgi:hypothetical protein
VREHYGLGAAVRTIGQDGESAATAGGEVAIDARGHVTMPERSCYPEYQIADPQRQARRLAAATASGGRRFTQAGALRSSLVTLADEKRRPGTKREMARWTADRAVDVIRDRFGWDAVGYGSVVLGPFRSVPDEFRELAEKDI